MKFKEPVLADQFNDSRLHPVIRAAANIIDSVVLIHKHTYPNSTAGEFTITSIFRPESVGSYHSKWQALDSRTYDWDLTLKRKASVFLTALSSLTRGKFQFEYEPNERRPDSDPHLHIEFDDDSI